MELIYKIAIWTILFLGVGHCAFTFKKYKKIEPEALWFFSASLGLIFNGLLNYINLSIPDDLILKITIGANIFQFIFFSVLAFYIPKPTILASLIISIALLILAIAH